MKFIKVNVVSNEITYNFISLLNLTLKKLFNIFLVVMDLYWYSTGLVGIF